MTRRDYELLTEALHFAHQSLSDTEFAKCIDGIERATDIVADYLQADNKAFDKALFIKNVMGEK